MVSGWLPPEAISRDEILQTSKEVLARASFPLTRAKERFRLSVLGMDWDFGVVTLQPTQPSDAAVGADGKSVGILLLHGGAGDFKTMEPLAELLAGRFGFKVLLGTYPGRYYFPDPDRDWPGDTINPDGSVRTPIWKVGETIGPDQYDVVSDRSLEARYGTRTLARAKPGTTFYHRLAAWPAAFEEGMIEACRRYLPSEQYSVYAEGHSTGGPLICMLSQRIPNLAGVVATEASPFGRISAERDKWDQGVVRKDRFDELYIRTWRDLAKYAGPEALSTVGPEALLRLPSLMEQILNTWETAKRRPQFKCEYILTQGNVASLTEAATVTAARLGLDADQTAQLVDRFVGFSRELSASAAKPVPPFLISIAKSSRDHTPEIYRNVILPAMATIDPAPKTSLTRFEAGVHSFWKAEPELPMGIAPAVADLWRQAIVGGYFSR